MTAQTRFDTSKSEKGKFILFNKKIYYSFLKLTKCVNVLLNSLLKKVSIFDNLNANLPEKQGSSNKNTITLPNENEKTNEKIEFDSKNVTASSAESIFSDSKDTRAGKKNEPEEASTNIYLQVIFLLKILSNKMEFEGNNLIRFEII